MTKGVPASYKMFEISFHGEGRDTNRYQLVAENSPCLDTVPRLGLDATHSGMNKFNGSDSANFPPVRTVIRGFVDQAAVVLERRRSVSFCCSWTMTF